MAYEELNISDRRNQIIELISKEGSVRVSDLSKLFEISEVTIRNDLSDLEATGMLERVHGGAVRSNKAYLNMTLRDRAKTNETEKNNIAAEAAKLIYDGDTIMVNSGTTTLLTVRMLKDKKNLTIVTNSMAIAQEAINLNNTNIIVLGGNFNPVYQFIYGDDTIHHLQRYKADKLILSVDGVNVADGISTYHHFEAEVCRQMIKRVDKTIVVSDYTKINRTNFANINTIHSVDILVTNKNASSTYIDEFLQLGIDVRLV
jgi:DeoR/GlpR family transcriptional regulator of sugar metabolism